MTHETTKQEEQLPGWGWAAGIIAVLGFLTLFFVLRANSADFWAEDGAYRAAAPAAPAPAAPAH